MSAAPELRVTFEGELRPVSERLSFGRAADLEIGRDPHLHRIVGEFVRDDDLWWVVNRGAQLHLTVIGGQGSRSDLAPGGSIVLTDPTGIVQVVVGQRRLDLRYTLLVRPPPNDPPAPLPDTGARPTKAFVELTPREVDFMVTFARPLLTGTHDPIPTYANVARTWGVSASTLDNTLGAMKKKLQEVGLVDDPKLDGVVRSVISHSLVTRADLEWSGLERGEAHPSQSGPRFNVP